MKKEKKTKCDCGGYFEEKIVSLDNIKSEAMVCSGCKETNLTREQLEKFIALREMHELIDSERKIIKIGNSIGITLPEGVREKGWLLGKKVKLEALTPKSFKITLL